MVKERAIEECRTMSEAYEEGYNKAIDELLEQVRFEEKWLYDTGLRYCDITIAFNGIYKKAEKLKS